MVAFARETGVLPYAGVFLTVWAFGSLLAGLVTGAITWRATAPARFRIGSAALAASLLPLPFLDRPVPVGALLLVGGLAIAPTLIAAVAVIESSVPASRLTEALNWNTTGLAVGLAAGAAADRAADRPGRGAGRLRRRGGRRTAAGPRLVGGPGRARRRSGR